jgi:hypothetical protein
MHRFIAVWCGLAVDIFGYEALFAGTALLGVPVPAWLASRSHVGGATPRESR